MKKIIFLVVLVSFTNLSFAVELWNGFTSDMTKEEVIQRAKDELSANLIYEREHEDELSGLFYLFSWYFDEAGSKGGSMVLIHTPLPAYQQKEINGENIIFHFLDNKLFYVQIIWAAEPKDALKKAKAHFGNPTKKLSDGYIDYWALKDKDFAVLGSSYFFIDREARLKWTEEQKRIKAQKKADENAKSKSATDGITF